MITKRKDSPSIDVDITKIGYPTKITKHYRGLINEDDKSCPIRKIVLPSVRELDSKGRIDPSNEKSNVKIKGLQHKYQQTALLLISNECACNCRFCFRRRFVGVSKEEIVTDWPSVIKYLSEHKEINNVLLSGGDPLMLKTKELKIIIEKILTVKHIEFIRVGTKMLAYDPMRFDEELINLLSSHKIMVMAHFDHLLELDTLPTMEAIKSLRDHGVLINNQTVLLKGVNDSGEVLAALNNKLVECGIVPYYVFQMRPVKGADHFAVPIKDGIKIINDCRRQCNGLAKRFRYIMSHERGKIEILGYEDDVVVLKFHQMKSMDEVDGVFLFLLTNEMTWMDGI